MDNFALIEKILNRNNYTVRIEDDTTINISKKSQSDPLIQGYLTSAIISILAGSIAVYFGALWGLVLALPSVPLLLKVMSFKEREKENSHVHLMISSMYLEVEQEDTIFQCPKEQVSDLVVEVERDEHIYAGVIYMDTAEAGRLKLLEIFGDNHNFVKDDITEVKHFILSQLQ
jgi:hypothetical protein